MDAEARRIAKLREQRIPLHPLTKHRLKLSAIARRKPVPALWLANHEYKLALAAIEKERAMTAKERAAVEAEKTKAY
jgi:hypothetical protein